MAEFALDPRLAADTHTLASWALCEVLLMDDAHYPWLVLVPRRAGIREAIDLEPPDQRQLWQETAEAATRLRAALAPDKLNIAALGNMVPQLHVHVIGRRRDDPAWPRPVWGAVPAVPRTPGERAALAARLGF